MTDPRPEPPWLSLAEAAEMTGLAREAIRSRARRGVIPSRRNNAGELVVQLSAERDQAIARPTAERDQAIARPTAEHDQTMTGLVADLQAEIADLRAAVAGLSAEVKAAERVAAAEVTAKDALIVELKAMLADARLPWWQRWRGAR